MRDIRRYDVFRSADRLILEVYRATARFPREEVYGLTAQIRRAATSIPVNLIEDAARSGEREFGQYVNIAIGSCEEVRYELHLARRLGYIPEDTQRRFDAEYEKVKMMLTKLLAKIRARG